MLLSIFVLVAVLLPSAPIFAARVPSRRDEVLVIQSAKDTSDRLTHKPSLHFTNSSELSDVRVITVNPAVRYQTLVGFGGAFSDSTAYVFSKLPPNLQDEVLRLYYASDEHGGHDYSLGRIPIGSSDFTHDGSYSYDEVKDQYFDTDYNLTRFSISHDHAEMIPMMKRAMAMRSANGSMKYGGLEFFGTPWSAPAWMKRNKGMRNSEMPGLIQTPEIKKAYAMYLSEFVTAYKAAGIPVVGITVQNEPHVKGQFIVTYECMGFTGKDEGEFLANYLGPRLRQDHPDLKILIHDDQKEMIIPFVDDLLAVPGAKQYVDGIAFHWYGDFLKNYQYLAQAHEKYGLPLLASEGTLTAGWKQLYPWKQGQYYAIDILGDLNNWAIGWVDWNMLLEWHGGPEHSLGPCDSPIRCAFDTFDKIEIRDAYWHMGHFSRFMPRGSVRIDSSVTKTTDRDKKNNNPPSFQFVSVVRPDGVVALVVLNSDDEKSVSYAVRSGNSIVQVQVPSNGIQTLMFYPQ